MQVRTVSHPDAQRISHKVYQFVSEQEMNETKQDFDTHFKKSIQIIHSGKYNAVAETYLKMVENDNIWHNLNLQNGDLILVTKENTSLKVDEAERKEKLLKKAAVNAAKQEIPVLTQEPPVVAPFTPAEVAILYSGTIVEVAKRLNTSYAEIYGKRKRWQAFDKSFVPPPGTFGRIKKEKQEVVKTSLNISDLSQENINILWNNPISKVQEILNLKMSEIRNLRIEWCRKHPEFKIPRNSGFNPNNIVSNEFESKVQKEKLDNNSFNESEMNLIWEGSGKEVAKILNKTYQAVYFNRVRFCHKNPSFKIPAIAKFNVPAGCNNPVEVIEPKQRKKRVIVQKQKPIEPLPINDVESILRAVAISGLKPKTMTLANGVKLEF
jgi:hypothetical protein